MHAPVVRRGTHARVPGRKKIAWVGDKQSRGQTLRLLDKIGPGGGFDENCSCILMTLSLDSSYLRLRPLCLALLRKKKARFKNQPLFCRHNKALKMWEVVEGVVLEGEKNMFEHIRETDII